MRHPAAVLTALAIALSGSTGLAQAVATTSAPVYWFELLKAFGPAIVTGGIAYAGFRIAFANNNKTKKIEILYKEQIEAVKIVIGTISELTAEFTKANPRLESSIDYKTLLSSFQSSMRILRGNQLPILNIKSREVVARFVLRNIEISNFLHRNLPIPVGNDASLLSLDEKNKEFRKMIEEMIDYSYLVSDVLYRDLDFPGWKAITPKRLEEFDNEHNQASVFQDA